MNGFPTPPRSPPPESFCRPEDRIGEIVGHVYKLTDVLGIGAYGTVFKACHIHTGVEYAIKALTKVGLDPRQTAFLEREIRLHFQASEHPNVVSMDQVVDTPECIFVVLEYCSEGDLFAKITDDCDYVGLDHKAKHVFLQILDAVQHCHAQGVYHRDLKPENILVEDDGWTVKLADFGLATQDYVTSDFGCGSTFYMSPECQQSNPKPFACYASAPNDVWSLGVILVNLTCGRNPWKRATAEDSTFRAYLRDRNFLKTILPISDGLNSILQSIFEVNPRHRIGLPELRQRIWQCPSFSREPVASCLPISPPYSPAETPAESPVVFFPDCLDPVPNMDPLPVQQYPVFAQGHQFHTPRQAPAQVQQPTPPTSAPGSPRQSTYISPTLMPTPPASNNGSPRSSAPTSPMQIPTQPASANGSFPQQQLNTYAVRPASFVPSFQWGQRCSGMVPNFVNQHCWKNVSVF